MDEFNYFIKNELIIKKNKKPSLTAKIGGFNF